MGNTVVQTCEAAATRPGRRKWLAELEQKSNSNNEKSPGNCIGHLQSPVGDKGTSVRVTTWVSKSVLRTKPTQSLVWNMPTIKPPQNNGASKG